MRPMYETEDQRTEEARIVNRVAEIWGVEAVKLKPAYAVDFIYLDNGNVSALVEAKNRKYSMDKMDHWGGVMCSLHKWSNGILYSQISNLPFVFLVGAVDGIYAHVADGNIDGVIYSGRRDRNDPQDMEPVILLRKNRFEFLGV